METLSKRNLNTKIISKKEREKRIRRRGEYGKDSKSVGSASYCPSNGIM